MIPKTRSQAPAERTTPQAPACRTPCREAGASKTVCSQAGAWEQVLAVLLLLFFPCVLTAQDVEAKPNRWLLLCCGLPGDNGHRERLTGACEKIYTAAEPVLGVNHAQLRVLAGDKAMQTALQKEGRKVEICTRESVIAATQTLSEQALPDDECWIMLLGHSHLYDGSSQFNVQGKDFDQTEFAAWVSTLRSQQQVFLLTMPVSGFWIKPLTNDSRIIITATEADLEFTGTEMPYALADVLAGEAETQKLEDVDGDGNLSILDLYLAVSLETDNRFKSLDRLPTEHAQLDDNGDGRGSEVQQPYLPVESKDDDAITPERPKPIDVQTLDGFRSRHLFLRRAES